MKRIDITSIKLNNQMECVSFIQLLRNKFGCEPKNARFKFYADNKVFIEYVDEDEYVSKYIDTCIKYLPESWNDIKQYKEAVIGEKDWLIEHL